MEIQKASDTQVATLVTTHADRNEAESKYHTVLASAAVSAVPLHSAVLMDDSGYTLKNDTYVHGSDAAEEF